MELVDLDSPIGVEVRDVDLRVALADDEVAELLGAFARRHLLRFRHQEIGGDDQPLYPRRYRTDPAGNQSTGSSPRPLGEEGRVIIV